MAAVELAPAAGTVDATLAPVKPKDRIYNLDLLRGWAILGILAVNAVSFGWPAEVLMSDSPPPGQLSYPDQVGLWVTEVFFADKFRTLFTMLFGVSIFLVGGERYDAARSPLLVRRLMWLGLIGLIHGALLWYGDILLHYAYCGLLMMMFRSWPGRKLLWVGGGLTVLWGVIATVGYWIGANLPPEIAAKMAAGAPSADAEAIAAAVELYRSGWPAGLIENLKDWALFQLMGSPFLIPVSVPLMMLGLGLFKTGYLSGRAPLWVYGAVLAAGAANLATFGVLEWRDVRAGAADPTAGLAAAAGGMAPLITLFYVTGLILLVRIGLKPVTQWLAPVGRMAFTNYLAQTLIMFTLYYAPWGPMWFGQHGPAEMWAVVLGVWAAQLVWSPLWLSRFQMGPLEWLWRCLTYGRAVAIRKPALG